MKTGGPGRANGRTQDTGPWSDIDGGSTVRLLIKQSDLVMTTSKMPPCVCVGWSTCCTSPKESSRNRSWAAAGSVGFSRCTFRSPVMISCELKVATVSRRSPKSLKNVESGSAEPGLYIATMVTGPPEVLSDTVRSSKDVGLTMMSNDFTTKCSGRYRMMPPPRCPRVRRSGRMGARGVDDMVSWWNRTSDADIVLGNVPGFGDDREIEFAVREKFRNGRELVSEQANVVGGEFQRMFLFTFRSRCIRSWEM